RRARLLHGAGRGRSRRLLRRGREPAHATSAGGPGYPEAMRLPDTLAPLGERPYRLLFASLAVTLLGSWMTPVALAFTVLEVTASPTALGLVLAAEAVPLVALVLVGGVWADRLPRIRVMLAADVASATGQGVMALLLITGQAKIWQLAALAAVAGAADAF